MVVASIRIGLTDIVGCKEWLTGGTIGMVVSLVFADIKSANTSDKGGSFNV